MLDPDCLSSELPRDVETILLYSSSYQLGLASIRVVKLGVRTGLFVSFLELAYLCFEIISSS